MTGLYLAVGMSAVALALSLVALTIAVRETQQLRAETAELRDVVTDLTNRCQAILLKLEAAQRGTPLTEDPPV